MVLRSFFTALFVLVSSVSYGSELQRFEYFNNAGGLNNGYSEITIEDNEASDLQNVVFTNGGQFKTRNGFAHINSTTLGASLDTVGLTYFKQSDGTEYLVAMFSDGSIRKMDYSGGDPDGTWDDITGAISVTIDQDDLASFAVGEDTLQISDGLGTTGLYQWTGTGNASAVSGSPNCKYIEYHKRMAFAAGNDSAPSTLYFTDVGDISNWSTGLSGNVQLDVTDGSRIRGLRKGYDALYIWTDNSIWRLTGSDKDTFRLQRMVSGIGTLSHQCIAQLSNEFVFISAEGDVYLYDGSLKLTKISPKIEGTLDAINFSRLAQAVGVTYDSDYYLSLSNGGVGTNDTLLMFDTFHLAWSKFSGINANALATGEIANDQDVIFFGDYAGFISKYPSGTNDAGTAINAYYVTKQYRFETVSSEKILRLVKVYANQQGDYNLDVELRSDFESTGSTSSISLASTGSLWDTAVWDTDAYADNNLVVGRIEQDKSEEFFQLKFSNSNVDEPYEVKGWAMFVEPSGQF